MPRTQVIPTSPEGLTTANAVDTVERLLRAAIDFGASDLHLDPSADGVRVRVRRDGALQSIDRLPASLHSQLVGRCKALADLLVYRQDLPQEGRVAAHRTGIGREFRVATYPTATGERIAMRFDSPDGSPRTLDLLGLEPDVCAALSEAIRQPDGLVLLTGPSGSGKTTTMYSCLHELAARGPERSIMTVEDPIERHIDGVVQTEVSAAAGLDFARALRSLLRQDPDVLLVGEIRDRETAAIALEAGLTGHLVVSTLHAGKAPEVFTRLLEMRVEPFVLTTTVRGVLAQRLLRTLCDRADATARCTGKACARCRGTGYAGRRLIAEWLPMTDPLRRAILARGDGASLSCAAASGAFAYQSLRESAQRLVDAGITDLREVDRVLGTQNDERGDDRSR